MADKVIDVPGLGVVSFPDSMDDNAINAAIQAQLKPAGTTSGGSTRTGLHLKGPTGTQLTPAGIEPGNWDNIIPGVHPGSIDERLGDLSSEIRQVGTAASPAILPALMSHPLATLGGAGGGALVQKGIQTLGELLGYPGSGAAAGDAAGMGTAMAVPEIAPRVAGVAGEILPFILHPKTTMTRLAIDALRNFNAPPEVSAPEGPFRPNPNIARKSSFGGSVQPEPQRINPVQAGAGTYREPAVPTEVSPVAPEPFKPNPVIARRGRFGGSVEAEPKRINPVQSGAGQYNEPVTELPSVAPTPYKPNPNILKRNRFGGSMPEEPSRVNSPRGGMNRAIRPVESSPGVTPPTTMSPKVGSIEETVTGLRNSSDIRAATYLKNKGITTSQWNAMDQTTQLQHLKAAGVGKGGAIGRPITEKASGVSSALSKLWNQ